MTRSDLPATTQGAHSMSAEAEQQIQRAWSPLDHLLDESTVFQYAHFDADDNELGNCVLVSDLPTIWERALAAQVPDISARVSELLPVECWVTRNTDLFCSSFVGAEFGNGVWLEAMCCLPCRLRALLDRPNGSE